MGAYFRLNYRQEPASKWPALKAKFFEFLIDHHSEWKSIRNNDPLGYLPYMEAQFERVTGYKLVGLGACTEWIRAGTYYHWVIAQRGELGRCPRLTGTPPPEGPMMPPPYPPVTAAASPAMATPAAPAAPPVPAAPASNCSPASDGGDLHTGYRSKTPTGRGRTTPIKVPAPKKGCRCRRYPRCRPGYGRCWGLLRPEWPSNVSRAPYGPESLKEASPVPVQEEGFAADGSVPPPGS